MQSSFSELLKQLQLGRAWWLLRHGRRREIKFLKWSWYQSDHFMQQNGKPGLSHAETTEQCNVEVYEQVLSFPIHATKIPPRRCRSHSTG